MSANNSGIVLTCSAAFAAAAPVATVISGTMQTSPTVTAVTELQVPLTENWIATLSAMLITNNTRPRFSPNPIGFEGGSIIRTFATSTVLNGGAISTATYFIAISIV
jgi:hypothetical protein